MLNFLSLWTGRFSRIQSPATYPDKSLDTGGNHDAIDATEEIAYRFGWTKRSKDGGIYDANCKRRIADDSWDLLHLMVAKGWVCGDGRASKIVWGIVNIQATKTAAERLLS